MMTDAELIKLYNTHYQDSHEAAVRAVFEAGQEAAIKRHFLDAERPKLPVFIYDDLGPVCPGQ